MNIAGVCIPQEMSETVSNENLKDLIREQQREIKETRQTLIDKLKDSQKKLLELSELGEQEILSKSTRTVPATPTTLNRLSDQKDSEEVFYDTSAKEDWAEKSVGSSETSNENKRVLGYNSTKRRGNIEVPTKQGKVKGV
ncbi:hypothetical protein HHI36_018147 [Cryptolaemus montrouzieri]|uniref:Uncharacterized protein n=1 Tax=Cryptolaemus montrouzieri TaxID=559131 RepID=A0ABD2P008_9CUCU